MDKYQLAQYNHQNIQELIRFIDQKAGAILVIYGFIITAYIEFAKDLKFINPFELNGFKVFISLLTFLSSASLISLLIYQIYIILFEIIRAKKAENYTQEESSVLYFDHISKISKESFITLYKDLPINKSDEELLAQVYECSCIMSSKSEKLNSAIIYLFISILCLLFFIFLTTLL
ncbi:MULTISPECIES: hypothetical protein [Cytobacillus]|uniref:Pycsar effector protein domain-containing protein n=2 Tax=Cytobacillus TaxID=2675230 RepID=A0ABX3CNS2_9BACI|nr:MULTISPECIES: hypothetical protein [Cytobacillus]EWG08637.1 hypothetical protein PBF_23348 [Cytobacillus firmus DS1]OHX44750.1 hypothetical protein BBV17_24925 [Cytobacillus oceanisediminis]